MKPTTLILLLFAGFVCAVALTYPLSQAMSKGQDAAGRGMIEGFVMIGFPTFAAVALGIQAVRIARRHKQEVPFVVRGTAWILLLLPALVVAGVAGLFVFEMLYGLLKR